MRSGKEGKASERLTIEHEGPEIEGSEAMVSTKSQL